MISREKHRCRDTFSERKSNFHLPLLKNNPHWTHAVNCQVCLEGSFWKHFLFALERDDRKSFHKKGAEAYGPTARILVFVSYSGACMCNDLRPRSNYLQQFMSAPNLFSRLRLTQGPWVKKGKNKMNKKKGFLAPLLLIVFTKVRFRPKVDAIITYWALRTRYIWIGLMGGVWLAGKSVYSHWLAEPCPTRSWRDSCGDGISVASEQLRTQRLTKFIIPFKTSQLSHFKGPVAPRVCSHSQKGKSCW